MRTYTFEKIKNIFVLGDCHGEFKTFFNGIKNGLSVKTEDEDKPHPKELERQARKAAKEQAARLLHHDRHTFATIYDGGYTTLSNSTFEDAIRKAKKMMTSAFSDSIFIIAGDCGIGFNKPKYYEDLFDRFNRILSYNNSYLIFVRGNHDDPSYFDGEAINLSNIKAIPDYSVVSAMDKNILCVGGAISLDRTWRIKQEERINRFSTTKKKTIYWKNEAPIFDNNAIEDIANNVKIDCVVSHTAPSFVNPETHSGFDEWTERDASLADDIREERKVFDRIFEHLRDKGMSPKYWAYGHFDLCHIEKRAGTIFRALGDGFNPISIDDDIISFTQNEGHKKVIFKNKKAKEPDALGGRQIIQPLDPPERPIFEYRFNDAMGLVDEAEEEAVDLFDAEPLLVNDNAVGEDEGEAFEQVAMNEGNGIADVGAVVEQQNDATAQAQIPASVVTQLREELDRRYGTNRIRIEPYTIASTTNMVNTVTQNREI
jgi:hypothetical protein